MKEKVKIYPLKDATCKVYEKLIGGEWWAEWQFHPTRKWRFDYALPQERIAIEIDGGVFTGGRHSGGVGQLKDFEKMNAAAELGWRVFHYVPEAKFSQTLREQVTNAINYENQK